MGWVCSADWHAMDQYGSYVGYVPFSLILNKKGEIIKIHIDQGSLGKIREENIDEDGESAVCLTDGIIRDHLRETWIEFSSRPPSGEWLKAIEDDDLTSGTDIRHGLYNVHMT